MFNIKQLVNRITDNRNERDGSGEPSAAFVDTEEQHSAEGFLCPPCMKAFPSPEALEEHYKKTHENDVTSATSSPQDANSNPNGDVQVLQQEIDRLQSTLAVEKENSVELKREMLKLEADLNAKEVDATSLRSQEKELEEAKTFLTSEVTLLRQQLADSLEQISMLRKEKENVASKAESTLTENEDLKKEIASLQVQLSHRNSVDDAEVLRQELVTVQKLMNQLSLEKEKEIEALNNKLNDVQQQDSKPDGELLEKFSQISNELKTLTECKIADNQTIENCTKELSEKVAKISQLQDESRSKDEKIEQMKEGTQVLKDECDHLRNQMNELCNKIETGEGAKAALEGLQVEVVRVKKSLDEAQSQNEKLTQGIQEIRLKEERAKEEIKSVQSELASKSKELTNTSKELANKSKELAERSKELADATKELATKSKEVTERSKELTDKSKQLADVSKELSNKSKELSDLRTKFDEMKNVKEKEVEDLKKAVGQSETIIKEKESALVTINKTLQETESSLKKRIQELETLNAAGKDAEKQLSQLNEELLENQTNLNQQIEKSTAIITGLKKAVGEKEAELNEAKQEFRELKTDLEAIIKQKEDYGRSKSEELLSLQKKTEEEMLKLNGKVKELQDSVTRTSALLQDKERTVKELNEQLTEKDNNMQLLQSKVDEMIQQKLRLEQTCASNEEEKSQLLEKLISSESEAKSQNTTIEELSRKRDDAMAALQELGRENQSLQIEMAKIQGRKWADDSNATNCSSCTKEFTLTFRKHHCRHCGQIFCSDCSSKSASVPSSKKPVRVCDSCFVKLTSP